MQHSELRASVRRAKRIEEVSRLYAEGLNSRAIAERLRVAPSTVAADLRAAGIAPRKYERSSLLENKGAE